MRDARLAELEQRLATYGSDPSRWPDHADEARAALLQEPEFRRAWERERDFDRKLAAHRDLLDAEIARSDAVARLGRDPLRRHLVAGMPWRRVAAVVLLAGMLGGALDLVLPETAADPLDVAIVDPLAGFDGADIR
jgi:hypothetical protein